MSKSEGLRLRANPIQFCSLFAALALAFVSAPSPGQTGSGDRYYGSANGLGVLGAYSWDSSHFLLGFAQNRKLVNIGVSYDRRLLRNHVVNWQYSGELMPVALESDPVGSVAYAISSNTNPPLILLTGMENAYFVGACHPAAGSGPVPNGTESYTLSCTRRWTIGEALSPIGFQWNFLTARKLQPLLDGHGGYMYSTQPIPVPEAGAFNFTFDIGAGFELFRSRSRSIRAEYRYHHISNHQTAQENPGIDNGLLQVTYCFRLGRQ